MNTLSNTANTYKQQQVLTASPEQLILMLYNGCVRFMNEAEKAMEEKNIEKAHNSCLKAQNIVLELITTLNMDYPISKELFLLYDYVEHELIQANMKKDPACIANARTVMNNIREGWVEAMKIARTESQVQPQQKAANDSAISI